MSFIPDLPPDKAPVEPDPTTFVNRYPSPLEILRDGGLPGVRYCYVPAGPRQRTYMDNKWSPVMDVPLLKFVGPLGTCDTVVVMAEGEPIQGADPKNGIREWYVDITLEESIGVPANPDSPVAELLKEDDHAPPKGKK